MRMCVKWDSKDRAYEACDRGDRIELQIDATTSGKERRSIMINKDTSWSFIDRPGELLSMIEIVTPTGTVQIVAAVLIAKTLARMLARVAPHQQRDSFLA